uniref:Uncharacterized protein n=1 Tax=Strigamia maritima TaxID=126957 RepID=T1IZ33_STRMM
MPDVENTIEVFVVNNYVRTLEEHYSYDIIFLLCDIGGNIGLYFGMSCLTLVEIFFYCCKSFAIYYIYNLVDSYLDYPLYTVVTLFKDEIIHFPLIIECGETSRILEAKADLANRLKTNCHHFQLFDLLHELSQFANNPIALWNASSNFHIHKNFRIQMLKSDPDIYEMSCANISIISTPFGICTAFNKADMSFSTNKNMVYLDNKFNDYECNQNQAHFILPQNHHFHPKYIYHVPSNFHTTIDISRQTFIRINTPKSSCKPTNLVLGCEQLCYAEKLKRQSFNCRLPFMLKSNLPHCTTQETAKTTHKIYLETQFKTIPQKSCFCPAHCQETIFIPSITKSVPYFKTTVTYTIEKKIREEIEEQMLVSFIKLLCNVGSIVGIMTGLSIFSVLQYFI